MTPAEKRQAMGKAIVEFEGRYKDGKLQHYTLPAGDGGMNEEHEEIKQLLEAEGYQTCDITEPFEELEPITEAIKDAPMHWP